MRRYKLEQSQTSGTWIISATQEDDRRYPFADEGYRREDVARARLAKLREAERSQATAGGAR